MNVNSKDRVWFTIGDVGASQRREEVSLGGVDYIGTNYGWNVRFDAAAGLEDMKQFGGKEKKVHEVTGTIYYYH
jgi:hypothetical protein